MSELSTEDLRGDLGRQRSGRIVHLALEGAALFWTVFSAPMLCSLVREAWGLEHRRPALPRLGDRLIRAGFILAPDGQAGGLA